MSAQCTFVDLTGRPAPVSPEHAFIFHAARLEIVPEQQARLAEALSAVADWPTAVELATRHGVAGLIQRQLAAHDLLKRVPWRERMALERWRRTREGLQDAVDSQVDQMLTAMAADGVTPVVLKGAALATTLYPERGLRSMADIDLLVRPEAAPAATDALLRLGFGRRELYYSDAFNAAHGYHLVFRPSGPRRLAVEVHWGLASGIERRNRLTATALLRRSIPQRIGRVGGRPGRDACVLAPASLLVYLAAHAGTEGHAFGRLAWLADLAVAARHTTDMDWLGVLALAKLSRTRAVTYCALALARSLLGAKVPPTLLEILRPPLPVLALLNQQLGPGAFLAPVSAQRRALVKYVVVDNPAITARLALERLVPAPDVIRTYYDIARPRDYLAAYGRHLAAISRSGLTKGIRADATE